MMKKEPKKLGLDVRGIQSPIASEPKEIHTQLTTVLLLSNGAKPM
jgi:hypothetical protein